MKPDPKSDLVNRRLVDDGQWKLYVDVVNEVTKNRAIHISITRDPEQDMLTWPKTA